MSKIKDALRRAKDEREDLPQVSLTAGHQNPPGESSPAASAGTPQTKVINYSEKAAYEHKLITAYLRDKALTERFKLLRTKLFSETQPGDERTILVTSSLAGEGKTFIAVNLAISVALEVDQTVLLVDVNFKNPSVLKSFGIHAEAGLSDYLLFDKPLSEVLIRPGIEKLVVLPSGKPVENSAELLRSRKMQALINEMKHRYEGRYIFFDAPSLLTSVDAVVVHPYIDKTLFVVESGRVTPEQVSEALGLLEHNRVLGTILNRIETR